MLVVILGIYSIEKTKDSLNIIFNKCFKYYFHEEGPFIYEPRGCVFPWVGSIFLPIQECLLSKLNF